MADLQCQTGSAIEHKVRRNRVQLRPQPQLRLRQNVQARLEDCRHKIVCRMVLPPPDPSRARIPACQKCPRFQPLLQLYSSHCWPLNRPAKITRPYSGRQTRFSSLGGLISLRQTAKSDPARFLPQKPMRSSFSSHRFQKTFIACFHRVTSCGASGSIFPCSTAIEGQGKKR